MPDTKRLPISFNEEALKNLDKICKKLKFSRPQVINLLFSGDHGQIDFIVNELKKVHEMF